jgi:L-malate glycosyltransferase
MCCQMVHTLNPYKGAFSSIRTFMVSSSLNKNWRQPAYSSPQWKVTMQFPVRKERALPQKRVVMLTCQYTEILGGAEKQCATLVRALRALGIDSVVLTSRVPGVPVLGEDNDVLRFWTYRPPQLAGRHLPASLLWAVQAFIWIAIHRKQISAIHCHQLRINAYVAALANRCFGIPTLMKLGVGGERNDFGVIGRRKYLFGRRGAEFVIRHSTTVVATASQIVRDAQAWGVSAQRIMKVPNGVDLSLAGRVPIGAADPRGQSYNDRVRFLFVGRLSEEKNARRVSDAVMAVESSRPIEMHFLGDGPQRAELETRALENQREKTRIVFHGRVHDVFSHLASAHFLILVSESEGLSNALLEAASAGVVPVLSQVSGNADVIPFDGYPFFVGRHDVDGIRHVLERACNTSAQDWLAWSQRIAMHTRHHFSVETVAGAYRDIYARMESGA